MNLAVWLARTAQRHPEAPAIFHGTHLLANYRDWAVRAARIAGSLHARGLRAGDRVALFMDNRPTYLEALYGIWWAGLIGVPMNAKLHAREAAWMLDNAEAGLCLCDVLRAAELAELGVGCALLDVDSSAYSELCEGRPADLADAAPSDLAWLFYTSGTTGKPKGAMLSHRNLRAMTLCYFSDVDDVRGNDAIVYAAPMSHGAGLYNFVHVLVGARHVIPQSSGFNADEILALAAHHRQVSMFAAPTMVKRLVDQVRTLGTDCSGFKTIVYGGGPMYLADVRDALAVMGPRFVQIYGQGESPMAITALSRADLIDTSHPCHAQRLASVGRAQAGVEVRVVDIDGQALDVGESGEVVVRGDVVMSGYWRNDEATANALRNGWLWTGDIGCLDAAGYLTLKDRSKDVIISGGSNIYPREIEEVLLEHPCIAEVAVIGVADAAWGEVAVAFLVANGATPNARELDKLCMALIARFKRPRHYLFVDALPKNNYGKVLKTQLRERFADMFSARENAR